MSQPNLTQAEQAVPGNTFPVPSDPDADAIDTAQAASAQEGGDPTAEIASDADSLVERTVQHAEEALDDNPLLPTPRRSGPSA